MTWGKKSHWILGLLGLVVIAGVAIMFRRVQNPSDAVLIAFVTVSGMLLAQVLGGAVAIRVSGQNLKQARAKANLDIKKEDYKERMRALADLWRLSEGYMSRGLIKEGTPPDEVLEFIRECVKSAWMCIVTTPWAFPSEIIALEREVRMHLMRLEIAWQQIEKLAASGDPSIETEKKKLSPLSRDLQLCMTEIYSRSKQALDEKMQQYNELLERGLLD